MTTVVLDASVIVKWIVPLSDEDHTDEALRLLRRIQENRLQVLQPPHWLAEVAAVVSRLQPQQAEEIVALLYALEFPMISELDLYKRACALAVELGHHVFDTLYHAVALAAPESTLITADEHYYRKAAPKGRIILLQDARSLVA